MGNADPRNSRTWMTPHKTGGPSAISLTWEIRLYLNVDFERKKTIISFLMTKLSLFVKLWVPCTKGCFVLTRWFWRRGLFNFVSVFYYLVIIHPPVCLIYDWTSEVHLKVGIVSLIQLCIEIRKTHETGYI